MDFTKDELKQIYISCSQHALEGWQNIPNELIGKIQSMIDTYCEHKNKHMNSDGGISLVCSDCGVTTLDV